MLFEIVIILKYFSNISFLTQLPFFQHWFPHAPKKISFSYWFSDISSTFSIISSLNTKLFVIWFLPHCSHSAWAGALMYPMYLSKSDNILLVTILCSEQGIDRETCSFLAAVVQLSSSPVEACLLWKINSSWTAADQHSGEIKVAPVGKQVAMATTCNSSGASCTEKPIGKKLTRAEIKTLDPNDKTVYLRMYVRVCICRHTWCLQKYVRNKG